MNRINQELFQAARENNVPEVGRLLRAGADVNIRDDDGDTTPLIDACWLGHFAVVKELREHGADVNAKANDERTPLHIAVMKDNLALLDELLSPNASNGTTTILGKLKSRGGANIEAKDRYGDTPLHDASAGGLVAIVQSLLSGGANILAVNDDGLLPIHLAVGQGNSAVSKHLLQHFYATLRRLPLHALLEDLAWVGNPNITSPPLQFALDRNVLGTDDVVEILEYLVGQNPALLSSRDRDGSLPLHVACRRGASFAIVQSLVNVYKASVKGVTPQGDLPLFLACEIPEPSLDTIFLLVKLYPDLVYR
jgi:ankyrin repeat protein